MMPTAAQPNFEADRDNALVEMWRQTGSFHQICWYFGVTEQEAARIVQLRNVKLQRPFKVRHYNGPHAPLKARRLAEILPDITTPGLRARLQLSPAAGIVGGHASPRREASLFTSAGASAPAAFSLKGGADR